MRVSEPRQTQVVATSVYTGCAGFCPTWGLTESFHHLKHAELQQTNSLGISGWENFLLLLPYFWAGTTQSKVSHETSCPGSCGSQTLTFMRITSWACYSYFLGFHAQIQWVWVKAYEFAFWTSSQVMLMLLIWGPLQNHGVRVVLTFRCIKSPASNSLPLYIVLNWVQF